MVSFRSGAEIAPFLGLTGVSFSVLNLGTWDVLLVLVSGFGGLFLGSRIEDNVATLEAPVPFSGCVSFLGGSLDPRHSGSVWNCGSGIF